LAAIRWFAVVVWRREGRIQRRVQVMATARACIRCGEGEGPRPRRDEVSTLRKKMRMIGKLLKLGPNLLEKNCLATTV
jgi:hypothetical protein